MIALSCGLIGGIAALLIIGVGYFMEANWVDASSLTEYVSKLWFYPTGLSLFCFLYGFVKGEKAFDFVSRLFQLIG